MGWIAREALTLIVIISVMVFVPVVFALPPESDSALVFFGAGWVVIRATALGVRLVLRARATASE